MGNPVSDQNYGVSVAHDMQSNCLLADCSCHPSQ